MIFNITLTKGLFHILNLTHNIKKQLTIKYKTPIFIVDLNKFFFIKTQI